MKKRKNDPGRKVENFPVWTFDQALRAVPYLTSVVGSVRDLYVGVSGQRLRARRLEEKPGRPDRSSIIEHEEAVREARRLEEQFADAVQELAQLNVQCVDPTAGLAMIPFVNADQLAWLVFDLFDAARISSWRYHHDPVQLRRPLAEMSESSLPKSVVA
jgi:hypothetical protein